MISVPVISLIEFGAASLLTVCIIAIPLAAFLSMGLLRFDTPEIETSAQYDVKKIVRELKASQHDSYEDKFAEVLGLGYQVSLADKIIAAKPDEQTLRMAVSAKISALISKEITALEAGIPIQPEPIVQFATEHIDSTDEAIAKQAKLLAAIGTSKQVLQVDLSVPINEIKLRAEQQILALAEIDENDYTTATQLLDWLRALNDQAKGKEVQPFLTAFVDSYSQSKSPLIEALIDDAKQTYISKKYAFADIRSEVATSRDTAVANLMTQVEGALNSADEVPEPLAKLIFSRATDLLSVFRPDQAKLISQKLAEATERYPDLMAISKTLDQKLKLFSQPFELQGLSDIDGNAVSFRNPKTKHKLLYFTEFEAANQPVEKLLRLVKLVGPAIDNANLEVAIICVQPNNDPADKKRQQQFVDAMSQFQVWLLNTETVDGRQFLARCPIDKTPHAILMDQSQNVISLGARPQILQDFIFAASPTN